MLRSHTRKLAVKARLATAVCVGALFACMGAHAALPALRVQLEPVAAGSLQLTRQIGLSGQAPLHCAPTIDRVTLDGVDLSIDLKSPHTGCDSTRTLPFNLRVDSAASAGVPILTGQVYRVRVYTELDGSASLLAFHLIDTNSADSAPTPESGFWWSQASADSGPASPGTGASIESQDGHIAVGLFGFSESGAATWSFGSAQPSGRVASVSLVQLANGDPPFAPTGSQPSANGGPRLEIQFLSPSRALAWLVRQKDGRDLEVRPLVLARSNFATGPVGSAWSGQWVLVPDDNGTPRVFEFSDPSSQDADSFHLADTGNDASLDCRLAPGTQQPEVCTLSAATVPLADFDQVGIDHLAGRNSDGGHIRLIRIPR